MKYGNQIDLTNQFLDDSQMISKIGSWSWNVITNKVVWSKNMFRILGLEPYSLEPSYELVLHHVHNADKKMYEEIHTRTVQTKTEYCFENRIRQKDNLVIPVLSSGKCILDDDQNLIQMIGTVQDLSSQKELKKANQDKHIAEERDKLKSLIIGVIAHDIKSPFNHINCFSQLLIEHIQDKKFENVLEYGHIINTSTQQVRKVLDSLLQWARTDLITFNPQRTNLKKLVDCSIQFSDNRLIKKSITIKNTIQADITVSVDVNMFRTIIRNLISNAIKYCKNNGEIAIAMHQDSDEYCISISDTGIGMEAEILKNLFTVTKLISTNGTDNEEGHGLGLYICKDLVERHSGTIWFESKVGHGTTCNFTIAKTAVF